MYQIQGWYMQLATQSTKPIIKKNKIYKQGIGIAEKSLETRRLRNPKSLFWLGDP